MIEPDVFNNLSTGDKLRALAEVIRRERHDQAQWVFPECGSPSCIAGHAIALSGKYEVLLDRTCFYRLYSKDGAGVWPGLDWGTEAAKVLGIGETSWPCAENRSHDAGEPEYVSLFDDRAIVTPDVLMNLAEHADTGTDWAAS